VIDIRQFFTLQNMLMVLAAVFAILVARFLVVYGMSAVSKALKVPVPDPYKRVMFWGGLRGAISLALALSLAPNDFAPGVGAQLRLMTFGVVLFTLLFQGTTIERLIKRLGLVKKSARQKEKEHRMGHYYAARAAQEELDRLHNMGMVSGTIWEAMVEAQQTELAEHDQAVRDLLHRYPGMEIELAILARQDMLRAERTALAEAVRLDIISEDVEDDMLEELDARIEVLDLIAQRDITSSSLHDQKDDMHTPKGGPS
jgi:CPA1 family monovalent cation:H+ antiporter